MKRLLLFCFTFVVITAQAQLIDAWKVASDLMPYDLKRVYECPNGNILVARMDAYLGIGDGDDQLLCYSSDGNLLWSFGETDNTDNSNSNFVDIDFDGESNIYIAGSNFPQSASYPKSEVIKLSPSGAELWRINFTQQSNWSEEVFEIEITSDDRIFLLATLYNGNVDTITPQFIEIDQDGQTITLIPDTNWEIGYAELFNFEDGFLYAVENNRAVKLNYDGTVVWQADFNFGESLYPLFDYDATEYLVKYRDGNLYCALRIDDTTLTDQYFGLAKVNSDGQVETHLYTILSDLEQLANINPSYLEMNDNGDFYIAGVYAYGGSGPALDGEDDRGGKGGSTGTFVHKVDASFNQSWFIDYPAIENAPALRPQGTFMQNDKFGVVFEQTLFDSMDQVTVSYDEVNGSEIWSHTESSNEVNEQSNPSACMLSQEGALYVCGDAFYNTEDGNMYNIYLYKYFFTPVGIASNSSVESCVVYPNPAQNHITLTGSADFTSIEIMDCAGRVILKEQFSAPAKTYNIESLVSGVYFVRLCGESTLVRSFMKE